MKMDASDVMVFLVVIASQLFVGFTTRYGMSIRFDKDWAAHSAEQCAPYGVYHSKVSDFTYKCSETLVDSQPETR
tara:strand:- start:1023 stop:1247 length:225 start_codon:yes stop_codon:yes gene_type:complete